jgi:type IV pilus assembly protein PilV
MSNANIISRQRGITMVESLVALVVLSVGMLGIASLYITSLKANRSALVRTQAVNLAADIADRIRANRGGKEDYAAGGYDEGGPESQDCSASNCTPAQIAENDLSLWEGNITKYLPNGATGSVAFTPQPSSTEPNTYTITVQWPEQGSTTPSSTTLFVEL